MMVAASAAVFVMATGIAAAQDTIKIGARAPKTGPLGAPAAVAHWPNIKLWTEEVNNRGGLQGRRQADESRVGRQDHGRRGDQKYHASGYGRQGRFHRDAVLHGHQCRDRAGLIAKFGYPHIATTAASNSVEDFAKRWNNSVWMLGTSKQLAEGAADAPTQFRRDR